MKIKNFKQFINEYEIKGQHQIGINPGIQALLDIESEWGLDLRGAIELEAVTTASDLKSYIDTIIDEIDEYKSNMNMNDDEEEKFMDNLSSIKQYAKEVLNYVNG